MSTSDFEPHCQRTCLGQANEETEPLDLDNYPDTDHVAGPEVMSSTEIDLGDRPASRSEREIESNSGWEIVSISDANNQANDLASSVPTINQELAERRSRRYRNSQLELEHQRDEYREAQRWRSRQGIPGGERQLAAFRRNNAQMQQLRQTGEPRKTPQHERDEAAQELATARKRADAQWQRWTILHGLLPDTMQQLGSIHLHARQHRADLVQESQQ